MEVQDAQRENRTVFVGGFWGQLVSSIIWLASAALSTWVSPKAGIIAAVSSGFFIYPLTLLSLRLSGGRSSLSSNNPLGQLGMQIAMAGSLPLLLLAPVTQLRLTLFYPALMLIIGAHYLPFAFLYGMWIFMPLAAALAGCGILLAFYAPGSFSICGWIGGAILLVFACIARIVVRAEKLG